jgi:hypothetical protein
MVVVYNFGGRIDTTISRHTKEKGRAEILHFLITLLFCCLKAGSSYTKSSLQNYLNR